MIKANIPYSRMEFSGTTGHFVPTSPAGLNGDRKTLSDFLFFSGVKVPSMKLSLRLVPPRFIGHQPIYTFWFFGWVYVKRGNGCGLVALGRGVDWASRLEPGQASLV